MEATQITIKVNKPIKILYNYNLYIYKTEYITCTNSYPFRYTFTASLFWYKNTIEYICIQYSTQSSTDRVSKES